MTTADILSPAPAGPIPSAGAAIAQRRLPYPYRGMLAICSDLDETPTLDVYRESLRFLNTTEPTAMGGGVGLEIAHSIYFDMAAGEVSY